MGARVTDGRAPAGFTTEADVLTVAAGVPGLTGKESVREGVTGIGIAMDPVRDFRTGGQRFPGDLNFPGLAAGAEEISPVPRGVGPINDAWLRKNAADATRISTRAEAARRLTEAADAGGGVGTGTMPVRSAGEERIIR